MFCVSFCREKKFERIERKFKTQNPTPSPPSDHDNHEELGVDALNTKSFDQVPRGHEVLMKECIEIYQEFFVTFLSAKAFTGNDSEFDPNGWLSKMVKRPNDTLEERTKYLEQLLQGTSKKISQTDLFREIMNL